MLQLSPSLPTAAVERLYVDSFPAEERRPLQAWRALASTPGGPMRLVVATRADGRTVGFATVWRLPEALYVEHLAVDPEVRGRGVGSSMIESLRRAAAYARLPLLLEAEPAGASPMAERRLAFYARHGLLPVDLDYRQPSYAEGLPEVPMLLLADGPLHPDPAAVAEALRRRVYSLDK